ncbi:NAD-P-binding protein [Vararia minispora EC-137]|uniref:NAD-P-binding protein n=1 Tax=Vararia minispora EC-137 TaxID=1314806 RepID=A0ACB8QJ33_9AGAM|nr:NAD-P-binding protein [Vararia minispora EC-137]
MGQHFSLLGQWLPPRSHFSVSDIPDLTGKVALVTGGNAGIGKETVKHLLVHGAKVYIAARSHTRAIGAINELERETGKRAVFIELDLANLSCVRKMAEAFLGLEHELHILGVMWPAHDRLTTDGYDLQFGTNVLGHYALTKLLLPALSEGARNSEEGKARVVIVASMAAYLNTIHWGSFTPGPVRDAMSTYELYDQSKHAPVVFAAELARRYGDHGLVVTSCNPGNLRTDLQRHVPTPFRQILQYGLLYPAPYGALTPLWAGTSAETLDMNGKFLIPWARLGECRPEANDPEISRKLWKFMEKATGV